MFFDVGAAFREKRDSSLRFIPVGAPPLPPP